MADSQRGDYPPTDQAQAFFTEVTQELRVELNALDALIKEYIPSINNQVSERKIQMMSE